MKHYHKTRLLKLCDFLEQLPRKQFDFATVVEHQSCGTVGCAMGWTPKVFPRLVKWTRHRNGRLGITLKGRRSFSYVSVAASLFDLSDYDANDLFTPDADVFVGPTMLSRLPSTATPKQVAKRIRRFVKLVEKAKATR